MKKLARYCALTVWVGFFTGAISAQADDTPQSDTAQASASPHKHKVIAPHEDKSEKLPPDTTGHKRVGKASVYAKRFAGHEMADGSPMQPQADNAASKTLPLGTTAKVTNMETGESAVVKIEDRGPYVKGRIVDLSPATAEKIGIEPKDGVAKVSVVPIAVPLPNGEVKSGEAAHEPANH